MSKEIKLSKYTIATRYWQNGHFWWDVPSPLDVLEIVTLYASLDPVDREALLKQVERDKETESV